MKMEQDDNYVDTCSFCLGTGVVPDPLTEGVLNTKCPVCDGTGEVYNDEGYIAYGPLEHYADYDDDDFENSFD